MVKKPVLTEGEVIRHIEEDEFDSVLELLQASFPHVSREFFTAITLGDPAYDPRFSIAVERDGSVLSYLQIFDRTVFVNGRPVRVGGVGSVGTLPQHRRRGYAGALLFEAIEIMKDAGMQASMLFTSLQPYYRKFGWKVVPQMYQKIPLPPSVLECSVETLAAEADTERTPWPANGEIPGRFLRSLKSVYAKNNPKQTGRIQRSDAYWSRQQTWCTDPGYLLRAGGASRAYFRYRPVEDHTVLVTEYGIAAPRDAERLIHALLVVAKETEAEAILGSFFASEPLRQYLSSSTLPLQNEENHYMMWLDFGKKQLFPQVKTAAESHDFSFWITDAF